MTPDYSFGYTFHGYTATILVVVSSFIGFVFSAYQAWVLSKISIHPDQDEKGQSDHARAPNVDHPTQEESKGDTALVTPAKESHIPDDGKTVYDRIEHITAAIRTGANAFLKREYTYLAVFALIFSVVIIIVIGIGDSWVSAAFTFIAFNTGAITSIACGFLGMQIATYANGRVAVSALKGWGPAFVTSFRAGIVMGFCLVSLGLLMLYIITNWFRLYYDDIYNDGEQARHMFEAVAGYGLGGSSIALFGRVGGGIYTKAADVGADLCGKLEFNIPEDDPRNPATIADNVGDNVGDIAGMGADLFGSLAEATCACMVIASESADLHTEWAFLVFPMVVMAVGICTCLVCSFAATHIWIVEKKADIEPSLKRQILISTILMTPVTFLLSYFILPETFEVSGKTQVKNWHVFFCIFVGLWSGLIIGYITEYYTSNVYKPVQEVADSCKTGAATNIIYGLALGYQSAIIPALCLCICIYTGFSLAGMYGIATAALGILSTLPVSLTIDAYGPICDNAGGIAEMAEMGKHIREITDALDAAGNTTAAIGKGFAIGSAALVSLALWGAFVTTAGLSAVDILRPFQFAGLLGGAMLPYWFSALTMKSVGKAAYGMVSEVRRQFTEHPEILEGKAYPDYGACVDISTKASLREMIAPGLLVILSPLAVGFFFGVECLSGMLAGALVSGVSMAISSANSGGAWDNAKKYIEGGQLGGKGSDAHKAAVVGDTVGDPLKDTSGPSLNILIKLMAIISLVFARSFPSIGRGGWVYQWFYN